MIMRKAVLLLFGALIVTIGTTYAQDKPLVRYDEEIFGEVAKMVDQKLYNDMLPWGEKVFLEYLKHEGIKVDFTESDYTNAVQAHDTCAASFKKLLKYRNELLDEKTNLQTERDALKTERDSMRTVLDNLKDLKDERDALQIERDNLKAERDSLIAEQKALINLKKTQRKLDSVFAVAETEISKVYEKNKDNSFTDMNAGDLESAKKAYDNIKILLDYRSLKEETETQLSQINAWRDLKVAIDEAINYMEGKYNNAKRTACRDKINNAVKKVNLTGKQMEEKKSVLNALAEQETVNARFNELLNYLVNDFVVIPSKQDAVDALDLIDGKTITNNDNTTKQIVVKPNQEYHKKHSEALKELRGIVADAATKGPKPDLQRQAGFQRTIESIRNIYQ